MTGATLRVENLRVRYGGVSAVDGISFNVQAGTCTTLLGANGAGKTSTLRGISGLESSKGQVFINDQQINSWSASKRASNGLGHVLEGRHVFPKLTVTENLRVAAGRARSKPSIDPLELLPELHPHLDRQAGGLSGGQQQMLAIARAVTADPKVILLDEPTNGLSPKLVNRTIEIIQLLRDAGYTLLLVEQRLEVAQAMASDVIVLRHGTDSHRGQGTDPDLADVLHAAYLS